MSSPDILLPPAPPPSGFELAPTGQPIVVYKGGATRSTPARMGLDASGQWWAWTFGAIPIRVTPTDGSGFVDTLWKVATDYVAPAVAGVLGAAVGGPVGFAAAAAIKTWTQLARGAALSSTLLDQVIAQSKSIVDQGIVRDTVQSIATANPGLATLADLRSRLPADEDSRRAFDLGVALGKGQKTQALLLPAVRAALPDDRRHPFDTAMANGALARDYVAAVAGASGLSTLDVLSTTAAQKVDAPATPAAPSGPGLGTLAVVAGGLFVGVKWILPHLIAHHAHPGVRRR